MPQITEQAFESTIEDHLLTNGYVAIGGDGFDAERVVSERGLAG